MKKLILILIIAGASWAQDIPTGPWTDLFNGPEGIFLDGWEYNGDPPWHIEGEILELSGGNNKTYLMWPEPLINMELTLKYKLSTSSANSGIQVRSVCSDRSQSLPNCNETYLLCGPQLDVAEQYSGRLFEECVGFLEFSGDNIDECRSTLAVGEWMTTTARFLDDMVELWFNGEFCLSYQLTNIEHLEGNIFAIQSHPPFDLIEWEYIKIRDLDKQDVQGCTNDTSSNFNAEATLDDGSCLACTDQTNEKYDVFCDTHDCVSDPSVCAVVPIQMVFTKDNISLMGSGTSELEYSITSPGKYTVELLDIAGNIIDARSGEGPVANQSLFIKNPGLYFVKITSGSNQLTRKISNL